MKTNTMKKFYVKHFDDYHAIQSDTHKTVELGCFPVMEYGYCRYFGLFYKGRLPPAKPIINSVFRKITIGYFEHIRTGEDIGFEKNDVVKEITEALKSS